MHAHPVTHHASIFIVHFPVSPVWSDPHIHLHPVFSLLHNQPSPPTARPQRGRGFVHVFGPLSVLQYPCLHRSRHVEFDNEHCAATFTPRENGVPPLVWEGQLILTAAEHLASATEDADVVVLSNDTDLCDRARRSGSSVSVLSVQEYVESTQDMPLAPYRCPFDPLFIDYCFGLPEAHPSMCGTCTF
jgi:hypothetical protein